MTTVTLQIIVLLALAQLCSAFIVPTAAVSAYAASSAAFTATAAVPLLAPAFFESSSELLAAATIDPTSVLSGILGGILGSPVILLVPIVAALGVAFVIGWLIFAYATPQVEDDEQ